MFEGLVAEMLGAWNDYRGVFDEWAYWAPTEGPKLEVDFLLRRGKRFVALEAKSFARPRPADRAGLDAVAALPGLDRRILVYPKSPRLTLDGGIEVMDFIGLSQELEAGRL